MEDCTVEKCDFEMSLQTETETHARLLSRQIVKYKRKGTDTGRMHMMKKDTYIRQFHPLQFLINHCFMEYKHIKEKKSFNNYFLTTF